MWVLVGGLILALALRCALEVIFAQSYPLDHRRHSKAERQADLQAEEQAAYREMRIRQLRWARGLLR
jgi:hypothetical protein